MTARTSPARRRSAALIAFSTGAAVLLMFGNSANAAIVATVPLLTAGNYEVLAGTTVTNTGRTTLNPAIAPIPASDSLGLSPGTSITGFPPGIVNVPGVQDNTNPAAAQAQLDLTAGYVNAAGRPLTAIVNSNLSGLTLGAGVYAGSNKSPLLLPVNGTLTLDGAGDPSSVFIFETDSTLTTESSTVVKLVNNAQECNVFWQVGSSATLGTGSTFVGNILALTSIAVTTGVTVHGRALARNGAVTLDTDTFTQPTCATTGPVIPTTTTAAATTTTAAPATTTTIALPKTPVALTSGGPGVPGIAGPPKTGGGPLRSASFPWLAVMLATLLGGAGATGVLVNQRRYRRRAQRAER